MAQKVQVVLEDDLDGGTADETVVFGLDGTSYEIDLTKKNAAKLRDALAPWVAAGRRTAAPVAEHAADAVALPGAPRRVTSALGRGPTATRSASGAVSPRRSRLPTPQPTSGAHQQGPSRAARGAASAARPPAPLAIPRRPTGPVFARGVAGLGNRCGSADVGASDR